MGLDPKKVKELVLIYSELSDDYQQELMRQAFILQLKQSQLNQIQKENMEFRTDDELQKEIDRRANKVAKESVKILDVLEKVDDTDKAALFMLVNKLAGKENQVQESDISITLNHKDISMKEYLEKNLFNVDYDKAKEKVTGFMDEYFREQQESSNE